MQQKNRELFIKKAILIHSDKYDYSKTVYHNAKTICTIICPEHGEFKQTPSMHISKRNGCPKCGMIKSKANKKTTKEFIEEAKKIHSYDYSKTIYKNSSTKVIITCFEHGDFEQIPFNHLKGHGCKKCATNKINMIKFIEKTKHVKYAKHTKYDYSKVDLTDKKISIICPDHGLFKQTTKSHLSGSGCPKCGSNNLTLSDFITRAEAIHKKRYDYSKVIYNKMSEKVIINCSEHGDFEQLPINHLAGSGCPDCGKTSLTISEFINKSNKIHNNYYKYNKVNYINLHTKVIITCPEHGDFKIRPTNHIYSKNGCPICNSSKGELKTKNSLDKLNIKYCEQKRFSDCKNKAILPFDFYLPELNIAIEYDGIQHFKEVEFFGGKEAFLKCKQNDIIKNEYCLSNNIKLIRINYNEYNIIDDIINEIIKKELYERISR